MFEVLLYIDPGSGSFFFQLLIAGLLAIGFYLNKIKHKLKQWFLFLSGRKKQAEKTSDEIPG